MKKKLKKKLRGKKLFYCCGTACFMIYCLGLKIAKSETKKHFRAGVGFV
jgi:hypothetical protein